MIWYYQQENQQRGPVSDSDLEELLRAGTIRPETMVWREGMPNWTSYAQAKGGAANPVEPSSAPSADDRFRRAT